jgi:HEAT repeat protein
VDSPAPEINRLSERATFAIALHDDARVDPMLMEMVKRPIADPMRSRAIYWLGNTGESAAKNTFFTEIIRNNQESTEARNSAMSALAMSRSAGTLPLLQNMFETMTKSAIVNLGRVAGQKSLGALTTTVDNDGEIELQKQAVIAIGRRAKDESIPILIRTARNHPKMQVRKLAIQVLGQTGDERAVAFFRELLSKD